MLSPRLWLAALIVAATALFVVGVSVERSDYRHSEAAGAEHTEEGHTEGEESESEESAAGGQGEEELVLGIDAEATPLIVLAVVRLARRSAARPRN